jgi:hypothetical protein
MFDEQYLKSAAQALELEIAPQYLEGVLGNLQRMAEIAAPALRIELDADEELAPVWRP